MTRDFRNHRFFGISQTTRALDDVTLQIDQGSIFGIVGESGSGKSTLARLMVALDRPTSGKVVFDGEDIFSLPAAALRHHRRNFQMVFQDPFGSLDPRQKVGRIIGEPLHVFASQSARGRVSERVAAMLENVGLPATAADLYPHQFSGGQRQRIAMARALITEPKLVVADEPVSALDLSVQAQILNLVLDLRDTQGVTFVFISHNLAVIDCIADKVGVMHSGRLVEVGPAHEVFDQPRHPYTHELRASALSLDNEIGANPVAARRRQTPLGKLTGGCAYYAQCPIAVARCSVERPQLRPDGTGRLVACHQVASVTE
ncbi:ATP-binding cassette domain-containing protein [Rhizobiaceae bacterium n13]|uniref:oligopeptide/dipeptide ABC transporter ATP-binding protein n=1 Tax=Ferirhizobium litorale TaxID=2927786 RepID=UPI0024B29D4E|nr:oligopeptide/dipeptide ABC transporter ATP-binding protein [Fererhizobium litorale]MDI7861887.1 ATP-binding cassette domain-containing protein [Fererhizobium litorale]